MEPSPNDANASRNTHESKAHGGPAGNNEQSPSSPPTGVGRRGFILGGAGFLIPGIVTGSLGMAGHALSKESINFLADFLAPHHPKGPHARKGPLQEEFPDCGPQAKYSDGSDCTIYNCTGANKFICEGGVFDDFECVNNFGCPAIYQCYYSFDMEDCENYFVCNINFQAEGCDDYVCGTQYEQCTQTFSHTPASPPDGRFAQPLWERGRSTTIIQ